MSEALAPDALTLVTGANGFVGGEVVRQLRHQGMAVRLAVRQATGADEVSVGDIGPDTDWSAALVGVERVIHCAARVHQMDDRSTDPLAAFRRVNRDGTATLARQAAAAGAQRLVFLSSIKVNGETTKDRAPFTAEDEPAPQDPYGLSKWEAEQALHAIATETGLEVTVIRPPLVYGRGVRANFARMMSWVARGRPLPFGLCRNQRSLVAVTNLASLAIAASRHPAGAGATLLASDGETVSVRDLLGRIGTAFGRPARLFPVPPALLRLAGSLTGQRAAIDRLCDPLIVDGAPTRQLLGWHPPVTMAEALADMAAEPAR
jgi:nucleoside-diphosphate-sugar epimerase